MYAARLSQKDRPRSDRITPIRSWEWRLYIVASCAIAAALVALIVRLAVIRFFGGDEIEFVHASWYIRTGHRPYVDFFENHHPLLLYMLALAMRVTGTRPSVLVSLRMLSVASSLAMGVLTFVLARAVARSWQAGALAALLLLSFTSFVQVGIEIRPDVPAALCGLAATCALVGLGETGRVRYAAAAGTSLAVGVLFSQKLLLLAPPVAVVAVVSHMRGRIGARALATLAATALAPCAAVVGYLVAIGMWHDYVLLNWVFNTGVLTEDATGIVPHRIMFLNAGFWLLASAGSIACHWKQHVAPGLRATVAVAALTAGELLVTRHTGNRDALMMFPMAAAIAGTGLAELFTAMQVRPAVRVIVVVLLIALPTTAIVRSTAATNRDQLALYEFVHTVTQDSDRVFDRHRNVNLFRADTDYFWYVGERAWILQIYRERTGGARANDYDACGAIRMTQPKVVSNIGGDVTGCDALAHYEPTRYPAVYIRRD